MGRRVRRDVWLDPDDFGTVRSRREWVPATVALYIIAAYWFTSSTSFANPAITVARSLTNTFAGIAPRDVPPFVVAQLAGAVLAAVVARYLFDPPQLRGRNALEKSS